jgi:hypothetical protein
MRVGRTVEQLRARRHAFLGTYVPPIKERQVQKVDPAEQVGHLRGEVGGEKGESAVNFTRKARADTIVALIITLGEDFWIGRRPEWYASSLPPHERKEADSIVTWSSMIQLSLTFTCGSMRELKMMDLSKKSPADAIAYEQAAINP